MTDKKEPRPLSEIQVEYQNLCTKAGNIQYQVFALGKDLAQVNESLLELNFEAAAAARKEAEAKKSSEEEGKAV